MTSASRPTLKDFDAYTDRNGQDLGQDEARDIGLPARTRHDLKGDPSSQAETARIASGTPGSDATDATEAEVPTENIRAIGDALQKAPTPQRDAKEGINRATAPIGMDEEG